MNIANNHYDRKVLCEVMSRMKCAIERQRELKSKKEVLQKKHQNSVLANVLGRL